ncbi:MAG: Asp23/Gls24 family envelope stress response protein [Jatrophihabitantaceae bacterium]
MTPAEQQVEQSTPVAAASAPALVDGIDVDAVAAAVRACAGVADLYAGRFAEVGSYLPGRRVPGVVISPGSLTVQVRSRWGVPAAAVLAQIAAAVRALRHDHELTVVIADIDDPPGTEDPPAGQPAAANPAIARALLAPDASRALPTESEH